MVQVVCDLQEHIAENLIYCKSLTESCLYLSFLHLEEQFAEIGTSSHLMVGP